MREKVVFLGAGMLAVAIGFSIMLWERNIKPRFAEKAENLRVGMTPTEVETVMGSEGEPGLVFISGSSDYWANNEFFAQRWEDAVITVEVRFAGPKGKATATSISATRKIQTDVDQVWTSRIVFSLLALGGLGLMAFGFCLRAKQTTLEASTASTPPPA